MNLEAYLASIEPRVSSCALCHQPALLLADDQGAWTPARPSHGPRFPKRGLCEYCRSHYPPASLYALEENNKPFLRSLPYENKTGQVMSCIPLKQLQSHPHFFPAHALGQIHFQGTLLAVRTILDATIWSVLPAPGKDYWVNFFRKKYGRIYTTCLDSRVQVFDTFTVSTYFDTQNRQRILVSTHQKGKTQWR